MASGPRVEIAETIEIAESQNPSAEDEEETSYYRYYRSKKVLGLLYRAIDEHTFMEELQSSTKDFNSESPDVFRALWSYVQNETAGFLWKHCTETAKDIKEM